MRLFIAVELSSEARDSIEKIKVDFNLLRGIRFVEKNNIHITLKFLGEVEEEMIPEMISALQKVKFKPFKLSLSEIGVFPNENNMRVLWVDAKPAEPLAELKKRIDLALPGARDSHPFKNHITIARITTGNTEEIKAINNQIIKSKIEPQEFTIKKFVLYSSTLSSEGPIYEMIKVF
jgi:2'-5' RNA ligase